MPEYNAHGDFRRKVRIAYAPDFPPVGARRTGPQLDAHRCEGALEKPAHRRRRRKWRASFGECGVSTPWAGRASGVIAPTRGLDDHSAESAARKRTALSAASYPLTPIERYAAWTRDDGLPFDPWMRVHARLGAEILRPEPHSLRITGTVGEWEEWTGMAFPESADYVFPRGLATLAVDRDADRGAYWEPNVWMRHSVS